MILAVRMVFFAVGAFVVGWTVLSAIRMVVMPRSSAGLLGRLIFFPLLRVFRFFASERRSFERRDRIMAVYAPTALVMAPAVWLTFVLVGYILMFWAVEVDSFNRAFHVSGSSLLTLGFASVDTVFTRVLAFSEAALGLVLLALMIAFLPSMYSTFSKRETQVALLEVRAGSPPSAVVFLERYHRLGWLDRLSERFEAWEVWFTELEETHTSYGALAFFRSPQADRSWVTASGTILDTASLHASVLGVDRHPQANLCIRAGYIALRRIADYFAISYNPDPNPDDQISITRVEFDEACALLVEAGVPLKSDLDQAWRDYAGWRVNYDTVLLDLAELTMAPYAPWTADRSAPSRKRPRLRGWGRSLKHKPDSVTIR